MLKRYKKRNVKKNQQSEKSDVTIVKKCVQLNPILRTGQV